ncbi:MAG: hypothetical protein KDA44_05570 [Planctomycetales bacterium]|nr:hypothetical protein [Planctomycetales bacterium]
MNLMLLLILLIILVAGAIAVLQRAGRNLGLVVLLAVIAIVFGSLVRARRAALVEEQLRAETVAAAEAHSRWAAAHVAVPSAASPIESHASVGRVQVDNDGIQVEVSRFGPPGVRTDPSGRLIEPGPVSIAGPSATRAKFDLGLLVLAVPTVLALIFVLQRRKSADGKSSGVGLVVAGALLLLGAGAFFLNVATPTARNGVVQELPPAARETSRSDDAGAYFEQLTAPRIPLDNDPQPPATDGHPRAVAVSPEFAAEVRDILQESGLQAEITAMQSAAQDEQDSADDENGANPAPRSSARSLGNYAKDAVIIMWLGDPTPFEALRETPAPNPETLAADAQPATITIGPSEATKPPTPPVAAPAPTVQVVDNPPRPDWLESAPHVVRGAQGTVLSTDPFSTLRECRAALMEGLEAALVARTGELAETAAGSPTYVPPLAAMRVSVSDFVDSVINDEYVETVPTSVGLMKRAYMLVSIPPEVDSQLLSAWRNYGRDERIRVVSVFASAAIGLVALVFGLLKVDTWTRGYYSKRLFLGVPAAIIGLLALLALA